MARATGRDGALTVWSGEPVTARALTVTLHRGPAHVCEAINDVMRETLPGRQLVGLPIREAFPEPEFVPLIELMDECLLTGQEQWALFRGSPYAVLPRRVGGPLIGVTTASAVPRPGALPRLLVLPDADPARREPAGRTFSRSLERVG